MSTTRTITKTFLATIASLLVTTATDTQAGVTAIAAGPSSSCMVVNGAVKCWGDNTNGQIGNNSTVGSKVPIQVVGLTTGATAVSVGTNRACAVVSGAAWCWGNNTLGELGNGNNTNSLVPVPVTGLGAGVTSIASGIDHNCATVSGAVKCWGGNSLGQLGDGTNTASNVPVQVSGLTTLGTAVSAGAAFGCAVVNGGVQCWGNNGSGQLGNSTLTTSSVPVQVTGLTTGVTAVAGIGNHVCAIITLGAVQCWGNNAFGQVGDSTQTNRNSPVAAIGITSGMLAIAMGQFHSCAIDGGGGAYCWGKDTTGQLGNGAGGQSSVPGLVSGLTLGVTSIAAGNDHTCAAVSGAAQCWGSNTTGQLGDNSLTPSQVPVAVATFTVPDPPIIGTATGGNSTATVSYTPSGDGGSPITSYMAKSNPGNITGIATSGPILVSGLTNGTPYTFTVTATNAGGSSPPSGASNSVTPAAPGPFVATVTNTGDSGAGSLRQALLDVQTNCAAPTKTVNFNIAGAGPHPITLASALPGLSCADTTVDGYSQPGASANTGPISNNNANLQILVNGGSNNCFQIGAFNVAIKGLAIHSCAFEAIYVTGNNALIVGNYLGTDPGGMNGFGNGGGGNIKIDGSATGAQIGDGTLAGINFITAHGNANVQLFNSSVSTVNTNMIGGDRSGGSAIASSGHGIECSGGCGLSVITANRIHRQGGSGVFINTTNNGVKISENAIFATVAKGIDTTITGNTGIQKPIITGVSYDSSGPGSTTATGTYTALDSTIHWIEFFQNLTTPLVPSGQVFYNVISHVPTGAGTFPFSSAISGFYKDISVTVRRDSTGDTSEFSNLYLTPLASAPALTGFVTPATVATSQTLTFTNITPAPITFLSAAISGIGFTKTADTCSTVTLAASGTCNVTITFMQPTEGPWSGSANFVATQGGVNTTFNNTLSGTTTAAPITATYAPALGLDFGMRTMGVVSPSMQSTFTNTSSTTLSLIGVSFNGGGSGFSVHPLSQCLTPTLSLPPSMSCTFDITANPNALGVLTDSVRVDTMPANTGTPSALPLSVTGAAPGPFVATVTTTADTGAGSLRQALMDLQTNCVATTKNINFSIAGAGPHVIAPITALPTINCDNVMINGYSQPGATVNNLAQGSNAVIKIVIDGGPPVNSPGRGLDINTGANVVVKGLSIVGFSSDAGINVNSVTGTGPTLAGNFLGVLPDGTPRGNFAGISFNSASVTVGGTALADRNVLACNSGYGIGAFNTNSYTILQNLIGTRPDGVTVCANQKGIFSSTSTNGNIGQASAGNVIRGNTLAGIIISDGGGLAMSSAQSQTDDADGVVTEPRTLTDSIIGIDREGSTGKLMKGSPVERSTPLGAGIAGSNRIYSNSIVGNGQGIDLQQFSVSGRDVNDLLDTDSGGNSNQNYPEFVGVKYLPGQTVVAMQLNSEPSKSYDIDFYASTQPDFADQGQGEFLIASTIVTTDGAGQVIVFNIPIATSFQKNLSMLATDSIINNTSEFSIPYITPFSFSPASGYAAYNVTAGTPQTQTLTFTNLTAASMSPQIVTGVTVSVSPAGNFTILSENCTAPMVLTTCTVTVQYARATAGPLESATLTLTVPIAGNTFTGAATNYELPLSGIAVAAGSPAISITGTTTFPNTTVGTSSFVQAINITNSGTATLTLSSIIHSNASVFPDTTSGPAPNAAHWCGFGSLAGGTPNTGAPVNLAPSASCVLNLIFTPNATGPLAGTITINSNAPTNPTSISLTGTGLPPAPVITSPTSASGVTGSAFTYSIIATNIPTSYGATSLPPGLTVNSATGQISGTPSVAGTFAVTITATNAGGTGSQALTLTIATATVAPTITSTASPAGTVGIAYSKTFTATGTTPITWTVTTGALPTGLTLNSSSGVLSGTPTAAGTFSFTVQAANGTLPNATQSNTIVINAATVAPVITSTAPTSGTTGTSYSHTFAATGTTPITWTVTTGTLPSGLTLNSTTGVLSGTPTAAGTFSFTVQAANGTAPNASQSNTIVITTATVVPTITSTAPPAGTVSAAYSHTFTATGTTPITWTLTTGTLPSGLTLNSTTGILSGTPTAAGAFSFTVQAANGTAPNATQSNTIVIAAATTAPIITSTASPTGTVGTAYSKTFTATGTTPITWSIASGTLPTGLTLNSSTGVLSGIPTVAGTFSFTVQAANGTLPNATQSSTIIIAAATIAPTITSTSPASGTTGSSYSHTFTASGTTPITWSVAAGALPAGLTLNAASGILNGTPTAAGTFTFTIQAANGTAPNATQNITIVINAVIVAPTITYALLPTSITTGGTTVGTVTINNSNTTPLTANAFTFAYVPGLVNAAAPNASATCPGANIVATPGAGGFGQATSFTIPASSSCTFSSTVTTSTAGTYTGAVPAGLIVTSAGSSAASNSVTLIVTNAPAPAVTLSPTSINFGARTVNTTSPATAVTLTNSGTGPLTINSITGSGDFGFTSTCPLLTATLAPLVPCAINVTFAPLTVAALNGVISVASNATGSPHRINLSGIGTAAPVPGISIAPAALTFAAQTVNTTSATQNVTVTNTGFANLTISSITIGAPFRRVALAATANPADCASSLAPGSNCQIGVAFAPTGTGALSGSISITDDAAGSPHTVGLTGTGTPVPVAVISVTSPIAFGDQIINTASSTRNVTIANTGTATLAISAITLTGANATNFTLSGQNGCTSIAAAGNCSLTVSFNPTSTGAKTAQINITSNAQNAATVNAVSLSGNGTLAPRPVLRLSLTTIGFGNTILGGATPSQVVTLTNSGGVPLNIANIAVAGDFAQTNNCGSSVAAQASCTINILFTPAVPGAITGELLVATDALTSPDRVQLSGMGCRWFSQAQSRFFLTSCG